MVIVHPFLYKHANACLGPAKGKGSFNLAGRCEVLVQLTLGDFAGVAIWIDTDMSE